MQSSTLSIPSLGHTANFSEGSVYRRFINSPRTVLEKIAFWWGHGRLMAAWCMWACGMMCNSVANVWAQRRADFYWPRDTRTGKVINPISLPDWGFDVAPYFPSDIGGVSIPDFLMNLNIVLCILRVCLAPKPGYPSVVLKRALLLSSFAYLGRAMSVPLTMLPNPDRECVPLMIDHGTISGIIYSTLVMPFGLSHTCADVFYSGHTIPITIAALVWLNYCGQGGILVAIGRFFGVSLAVFSLYVIVATHFHYTNDVLYAAAVTVTCWILYHKALTLPVIFMNSPFLQFWEADSLGPSPAFTSLSAADALQTASPAQTTHLLDATYTEDTQSTNSSERGITAAVTTSLTIPAPLLARLTYERGLAEIPLNLHDDPRVLWAFAPSEDFADAYDRGSEILLQELLRSAPGRPLTNTSSSALPGTVQSSSAASSCCGGIAAGVGGGTSASPVCHIPAWDLPMLQRVLQPMRIPVLKYGADIRSLSCTTSRADVAAGLPSAQRNTAIV